MTTGEQYYEQLSQTTGDDDDSRHITTDAIHEAIRFTIATPNNAEKAFATDHNGTLDRVGTVYVSLLSKHKVYLHFADKSYLLLHDDGKEERMYTECGMVEL